jgi:hypothetical protein
MTGMCSSRRRLTISGTANRAKDERPFLYGRGKSDVQMGAEKKDHRTSHRILFLHARLTGKGALCDGTMPWQIPSHVRYSGQAVEAVRSLKTSHR